MKKLTHIQLLQEYCKLANKWAVYLGLPHNAEDFDEIPKAATFIDLTDDAQAVCDENMYVICDSEKECEKIYLSVVGDDGPTTLNPYDGPCRIYALTVNNKGELENENT